MSLMDALEKAGQLSPISVPELRYLQAAADRVRERWPDVQVAGTEKEREALAQQLRDRVERWDWEGTRLSFVISAASAVFDPERRDRQDLSETRKFLYAEIAASTSGTFLAGLLRAHVESYEPGARHTAALANRLREAEPRMGGGSRLLLEAVPELLDPTSGPKRLAERMRTMSDPFTELVRLGLRSPHGIGFMDHAHFALTALVRPELSERDRVHWYISWLRPPGREEGRTAGAEAAIEALIHPWLNRTPDHKLRSYLVETRLIWVERLCSGVAISIKHAPKSCIRGLKLCNFAPMLGVSVAKHPYDPVSRVSTRPILIESLLSTLALSSCNFLIVQHLINFFSKQPRPCRLSISQLLTNNIQLCRTV